MAAILLFVVPAEYNQIIEDYLIQEYPNQPYEYWRKSAINGVSYGIATSGKKWKVVLKDIVGHPVHTNSPIVCYTAFRAFRDFIGLPVLASEAQPLEAFVYEHWKRRDTTVADLATMTLIK